MGLKKRNAHVGGIDEMYESVRHAFGPPALTALKQAAACILWKKGRDGRPLQVYLAKRSLNMKFLGGMWAFIGGGVHGTESVESCALREVDEEIGLVIEASRLVPAGRWMTPDVSPIRYDTHYFLVQVTDHEIPEWKCSQGELCDGRFMEPKDIVAANHSGEMLLPSPVWRVINTMKSVDVPCSQLIGKAAAAEAKEDCVWHVTPDVYVAPLRSLTLPPATRTNAYLLGNVNVFIVDPGTPFQSEIRKLINALKRYDKKTVRNRFNPSPWRSCKWCEHAP